MKGTIKKTLAICLLVCTVLSYIVPTAYGAETKVVYHFNQFTNYNKLPTDTASGEKNLLKSALTGDLGESTCQVSIPDRFASGDLNWTYESASEGICGTTTENEHLPDSNTRVIKNNGIRSVITENNWIAFRIKSPGTGEFSIDLTFYQYSGSPLTAFYILPAEGEASLEHDKVLARRESIQNALHPDNRIGMTALYECKTTGLSTINLGKCTLEADKEYIIVCENYQKAPLAGNSYVHLHSLTFIAGESTNQKLEPTEHIRPVLAQENVVPASDGGAMGALYEVNGHDYFFLPLEGSKMAIYDLDEWKLVDTVESGLSYPTSATVTPDGKIFVGGNGTKMFVFDAKTMTGSRTPDYRTSSTALSDESAIKGIHAGADGMIYLGTLFGGHLLQYDIKARTYLDLGDMVCGDIQKMVFPTLSEDEVEDNGGVYGCNYLDGYIYAVAGSDSYSIAIKYDLEQQKVVNALDIRDQFEGDGNYEASLLGDKYLMVGGSEASGFVLIDLATFKSVSYSHATKNGIITVSAQAEDLWDIGVDCPATEVIDGKQYFNSKAGMFAYTVSTGKLARVGNGGYNFRTGGRTYVTLDRNNDGVEEPYLFTYGGSPLNPRLFDFNNFNKISTSGLIHTQYEGGGGSSINIGTSYDDILYIGSWNNWNCAAFDTNTETISNRYVTGGQTDSQTHYIDDEGNFHLISGNYSACVVYEIDPINKTGYNGDEESNIIKPLIANMKKYDQKRIHTVAAGDGYVFAGTIPNSYLFGGGIGVYNSATDTEDFIRFKETSVNGEKVIPNSELWDLSVNGIVYHDGFLYGCTTTHGGTGAGVKTSQSAKIFVFDYENMEIEAILDLRDYIPEYLPSKNGVPLNINYIGGISVDDQGRFWSTVSDVLFCFTYDKAAKTFSVQVIYDRTHTKYTTSSTVAIQNRKAVFDPENNSVYTSLFAAGAGTYQIELADWEASVGNIEVTSASQIMDEAPKTFTLGANDNLYYAKSSDLYMLPINVKDTDWSNAKALDAQIDALGDIALSSSGAVTSARETYEAMSLRDKALVQKLYVLEEAEAKLLELQIAEEIQNGSVETMAALMIQYQKMSAKQQQYVRNYSDLEKAYDSSLEPNIDAETISVQERIDALTVTSRRDEGAVVAAREAYEALSAEQQVLVNISKLIISEEKLIEIKDTAANQFTYDFKLYDNSDFMNGTISSGTDIISSAFAGSDNNLYSAKVLVGSKNKSVYNWFFSAYSDTINWAPEACNGANSDKNLFKDATVTVGSKKGLKLNLGETGNGWGAIRFNVPSAGTYRIDVSFFDIVPELNVYILTTQTGYTAASDRETVTTISPLLTAETLAAEIGSANLTDTISNAWNFEIAGDYIIVFQQKAAATKNIYLNSLTLTEQTQVSADIAIAQASDKYFLNLHDAFAYQVASNAETVKLTCDIWEQDLVFPAGAALDLNGYTLTANSILTYDSNALIDSSAEKSGMLKIKDADGNMLNEKNSQLPLYDSAAEGYRFFSLSIETVTITGKENPTYWFKITSQDFPNIYSLECSDLLIKVKLKWNGGEGTASANTAFTRKWLEAYNAKPDIYINVSAVNGDNLDNFTLIPCITANGVTLEGAEMK